MVFLFILIVWFFVFCDITLHEKNDPGLL